MKPIANTRCYEVRKELGLTQTEFARVIGYSIGMVQSVEIGRMKPGAKFNAAVERALNSNTSFEARVRVAEALINDYRIKVYAGMGLKITQNEAIVLRETIYNPA